MHSSPLFSFGFAGPAMLAWGVAIALPILVHLWRRRHSREETWGSMRLLEEAIGRSRRRLQIERGFLLLLRMLLILFLVLAVAEPVADTGTAASVVSDAKIHRVIVIDGSFSMAYKPTDRSRFEHAKEIAQRIVKSGQTGDGYSLVLAGSPPQIVIDAPVFQRDRFAQAIDQLQQPDATLAPLETLRQIEKVLSRSQNARYKFARTEIYFLSDFCRVGWIVPEKTQAKVYQRLAAQLNRKATLIAIDLGQTDATNGSITSLWATPSATTVGRPIQFHAELKYFGTAKPPKSHVELFLNGRVAQRQTVKFDKNLQATVVFSHTFTKSGLQEVELRLQQDHLDVDDRRFLIVPVHEAVRVLLVDGRPQQDRLRAAGNFLATALKSDEADTVNAFSPDSNHFSQKFTVETIHENSLPETSLATYDTVLMANVAQVTSAEAKALDRYVRQGGELVLFLGDQVMTDRYNRMLKDLLPAQLGKTLTFETPPKLDPLGYRHPIVQPFQAHPESGLLTLPIRRAIQLDTETHPQTQVVLATEEGEPLIVEQTVEAGRVILVATSADTSWTMAPIWPSFVPLVQRMASLGFEATASNRNLEVSQPIFITAQKDEVLAQTRIVTPRDMNLPLVPSEEKMNTWSFHQTDVAGIYTLQENGKENLEERFAVNVNPIESNLAKLSKTMLQNDVWPGIRFAYRTTWNEQTANLSLNGSFAATGENRASRNLLFFGLLLLAIETCWIIRNFSPKKSKRRQIEA
ncbi:MAG: BatA domain-containing protein [Planctomycetia bacterium]|jgi:hypothetical protein